MVNQLAEFASTVSFDRLPTEVRVHAKYVWLDAVGVILAGSAEPYVARLAERVASEAGEATILRRGCPRADVRSAALVNGTAGTALELDEGHRPTGHPAIYAIPALLAAAEGADADGKDIVSSLVAAYEVGARIGAATTWRPGVHIHGTIGPVGAAAGVSRLLDGDADAIAKSIRAAACLCLSTPLAAAFDGALVRNAYAGLGGAIGIVARDLAQAGLDGYDGALHDVYGSLLGTEFDAEHQWPDGYLISTNYFKVHAACRWTHPALDALELAIGGRGLRADDVAQIVVRCDPGSARCARQEPQNALAAKFSIPFAVATRIVNGSTDVDAFRDEVTADPDVRRLASRVSVVPSLSPLAGEYPAAVEVLVSSGERLAGEVTRPKGDFPDAISYEQVEEKFLRNTSGAGDLLELLLRLDEITVRELVDGIRAAAEGPPS